MLNHWNIWNWFQLRSNQKLSVMAIRLGFVISCKAFAAGPSGSTLSWNKSWPGQSSLLLKAWNFCRGSFWTNASGKVFHFSSLRLRSMNTPVNVLSSFGTHCPVRRRFYHCCLFALHVKCLTNWMHSIGPNLLRNKLNSPWQIMRSAAAYRRRLKSHLFAHVFAAGWVRIHVPEAKVNLLAHWYRLQHICKFWSLHLHWEHIALLKFEAKSSICKHSRFDQRQLRIFKQLRQQQWMWQSGSQKQSCFPVSNFQSSWCCLKASDGDMVFQDVTVDRIPIREGQTAQVAAVEKTWGQREGDEN